MVGIIGIIHLTKRILGTITIFKKKSHGKEPVKSMNSTAMSSKIKREKKVQLKVR